VKRILLLYSIVTLLINCALAAITVAGEFDVLEKMVLVPAPLKIHHTISPYSNMEVKLAALLIAVNDTLLVSSFFYHHTQSPEISQGVSN
jgi:hypothetical protein